MNKPCLYCEAKEMPLGLDVICEQDYETCIKHRKAEFDFMVLDDGKIVKGVLSESTTDKL
jgi:hypothetical protein